MTLSNFIKSTLLAAFITVYGSSNAQEKPNVIIIYTDDQGSIDLNIYGAKDLQTPNMDALVKSGVRFTQFYGAPVCSPSRAGLLTGKTPQRAGVPGNVPSVPVTTRGLKSEQYTMVSGIWVIRKGCCPMIRALIIPLDIMLDVLITTPISTIGEEPIGMTYLEMVRKSIIMGSFFPVLC